MCPLVHFGPLLFILCRFTCVLSSSARAISPEPPASRPRQVQCPSDIARSMPLQHGALNAPPVPRSHCTHCIPLHGTASDAPLECRVPQGADYAPTFLSPFLFPLFVSIRASFHSSALLYPCRERHRLCTTSTPLIPSAPSSLLSPALLSDLH